MQASQKKIVCILDALDECFGADRDRLIEMLCDFHQADNVARAQPLKFLVTSRPYDDVQQSFDRLQSSASEIRLRGEHENKEINREINMVIERQIKALGKQYKLSEDSQNVSWSHLLHMEHRTYLWLHLAMSTVRDRYRYSLHPNKVNIAELSLPLNVGAAYDQVLSKIGPALRGRVVNILLVVVGARRPLTTQALFTALKVLSCDGPDEFSLEDFDQVRFEEQIRDWCGLFIYVEQSRVYLIHQTAKEYLLDRAPQSSPRPWQGCLVRLDVEQSMARMCLKYLCIPGIEPYEGKDAVAWAILRTRYPEEYDDDASPNDFYHYCAENWASHLQECDAVSLGQDLREYMSIVAQPSKIEIWSEIMWPFHYKSINASMQHVLAAHGHTVALGCLHSNVDIDWNACDGSGKSALHWAASHGHIPTVRLLIEIGADIDMREDDDLGLYHEFGYPSRGRTALHLAAERGQLKTLEFLLDSGADINAESYDGRTPLELMVYQYRDCSPDMIRAFMGRSSARTSDALCEAATQGDNEIVKLLIELGTDVNAMNRRSQTALCAAVPNHLEVAATLLDAGADINRPSPGHNFMACHKSATPLTLALFYASRPLAELFLEAGADVDSPDEEGNSILQLACAECTCEAVQMLLDHKRMQHVSVHHEGFYDGALATAVKYLNLKVVDLLFSQEPLAVQGENFDAALSEAAAQRSWAPVQALLSHAAKQIDAKFYRKLLGVAARSAASKNSEGEVLRLMLEYKPEPLFDTDFREMVMQSICGSFIGRLDSSGNELSTDSGKLACRLIEYGKDAMSHTSYFQVLKVLVVLLRPGYELWNVVENVMEQISTNVHGGSIRCPASNKAPPCSPKFSALETFLDQQPYVDQNEESCRDIVHKALHVWHETSSRRSVPGCRDH